MLNRATSTFRPRRTDEPGAWEVDRHPTARLVWLWVAIALPIVVVLGRLAYLQCCLTDEFASGFEILTTEFEPIPKRDGRILGSDGRVLAHDLERFRIEVHYRWLEEPPNEGWLKQQIWSRLSRAERRDPERVATARQAVLDARDEMWLRLAQLTGTPPSRLAEMRAGVQRRIERMIEAVEQRRAEREAAPASPPPDSSTEEWWQRAWRVSTAQLTTPPHRKNDDPLILREELDYHPLIDEVPLAIAAQVESHPERFPGLRIAVTSTREYPEGSLAPHIIGSRLPIGAKELARRAEEYPEGDPLDYRPGDRIGRSGVERSYDRRLRGLRGRKKIVRNRRGEIIATEIVREPRNGEDLILTLHLPLQERMEQHLDKVVAETAATGGTEANGAKSAGAAIIAIDVHTGAVLCAASAPRYDLRLLTDPDPLAWQTLMSDPRQPMFHRATQMAIPPGSVFKPLSAIAFMEAGHLDPDAKLDCRGYFLDNPNKNRCYIFSHYGIGHGPTDLTDALARSCNVYFFSAAERAGPEPLVDWAGRLGFGEPTGIDLPSELAGHVPSPDDRRPDGTKAPWYPGDTRGLAIGQSRLLVTPMQVARMMAVIANGGHLIIPHVVRTTGRPELDDGPGSFRSLPTARVPGLSDAALSRVREGLEKVVADRHGTGYKTVRMNEIAIAGKTGTAEVGGGRRDHAWFAGYVPADRPRIAFAVVLEHAGGGGSMAGPVARQLVETMLDLGLLTVNPVTAKR